jgi:hypothetical protein
MSRFMKTKLKRNGVPVPADLSSENLTPSMVATILHTTIGNIAQWRFEGYGPPWFRPCGASRGKVLYPRDQFEQWRASLIQRPKKGAGAAA